MVEHYLNKENYEKLLNSLPLYAKERENGMNAGVLAEQISLPLQDVLSFLIEKNELKGEQIDFELARIMLQKNVTLQGLVVSRCGISYKELDHALAKVDYGLLTQACNEPAINEVYSILPQFIVFTGLLSLPFELSLSLVMAFVGVVIAMSGSKRQYKDSSEIITKLFQS